MTLIDGFGEISNDLGFRFGDTLGGAQFRGGLDEVRIYPRALSPGWIATEFANYSQPQSFVTAGPREDFD